MLPQQIGSRPVVAVLEVQRLMSQMAHQQLEVPEARVFRLA
jgi:hypothetical protein